jgi:5-methylthioadenosine/S-adenosylhomocysteine deaminase
MQPISVDLILNCRWLIPIIPENQILERHAIIIKAGRILEILPIADASDKYSANRTENLDHHAVMPGLINSQAHGATRLFRGHDSGSELPANDSLLADQGFIAASTELAIAEMLKTGTTCYADKQYANNSLIESVQLSGIRSQLNFALQENPTDYGSDVSDYLHQGLKLRDYCSSYPFIHIACNLNSINHLTGTTLERLASYVNELELPLHIQCNTDKNEIQQSIKLWDRTPIQRLFDSGLLIPESQLTHANHFEANDLALIQQSNCHLVVSPQANLVNPTIMQSIKTLMETENNISLATSSAGNDSYNLWLELQAITQIIAFNQPDKSLDANAHQALRMATINAAKALGLETEIGSLEPNKYADIIAIEINPLSHQPLYNLAAQLIANNASHKVTHGWVAGSELLANSKLCQFDEHNLIQSARDWGNKVQRTNTLS